jgi:hypothetical protein
MAFARAGPTSLEPLVIEPPCGQQVAREAGTIGCVSVRLAVGTREEGCMMRINWRTERWSRPVLYDEATIIESSRRVEMNALGST